MTEPPTGQDATALSEQRLHATCVSIGGKGVLLRGRSGAGKSDLALRMIMQPTVPLAITNPAVANNAPCTLVADDQVIVCARNGQLMARPDPRLAGRLEVRGIGIVEVPHLSEVTVALAADLVDPAAVDRLPDAGRYCEINGVRLPRLALTPFEASAVAKLSLAVTWLPYNF